MNERFLCCTDCHEATLIGHGITLYLTLPDAMEALEGFLAKHVGHQLTCGDENLVYDGGFNSMPWEELILN